MIQTPDKSYQINGIQQIGIGVKDVHQAWSWYRKAFSMDVPVFEDEATANLMTRYTNGIPESRHAVLALNMQGGGGFEIWQFTSRTPNSTDFEILAGDLGIYAVKIRVRDIKRAFEHLQNQNAEILTEVAKTPNGMGSFFLKDPFDNIFQVVEDSNWFSENSSPTGGVLGVVIGVSDLEKSIPLYRDILGFSVLNYQEEGVYSDIPGEKFTYKRALLAMPGKCNPGAFGALLCPAQIELIEVKERQGRHIFKDRLWGDLGFIHCCLDVNGMKNLKKKAGEAGYPFTVDSENSFDMGSASGHFGYLEDYDQTLIEFVETHCVPILQKWNLYLNLKKRDHKKNLPKLLVKLLALNRVKS
ncbi:MAG: VOC family protein [Algoriphagus sp.]|uniref:VOC family protein n=1 Tax=Algoriphagus sp. TaxID=1872435 RepID=UPI00273105CC|nr:VOC family protein [Algoriphagus sp.]MDP2041642.1 VOC family protein [Algoriphagus sp.]MDP3473199.1 VOC family protein [Algoriphagus sp.]